MTFTALALAYALQAPAQKPLKDHWPHAYDLLDVNWRIKLIPDQYAIEGEVTNTVKALADNATLIFDSVKLEILEVSVDGQPASKSLSPTTVVVVPRNRTIKEGETVKVKIKYRGVPQAGIYFIPAERAYPAKTPVVYTQGEMVDNRYWIPTYDYPDDKATSEGTIEVPSGWNTLSNGALVERKQNSSTGYDTFHWRMDKPQATYLISLVAGPYSEVPDGTSPVKTSIFVPTGLESWGQAAFGGTDKIIQFYGKLTHFPYPYSKFAQSAVPDFMYGGMENTTAVTQTISAIFPPNAKDTNDSTGLVAHELAHQWFGDTVTCPSWAHAWINEGWATFLPPFYERERKGLEAFDLERYGIFQGGLAAHEGSNRAVVFDDYREAVDMFDNFIYPGGGSRMFMLMHELGETKFWDCVGKYLNEYKYKNVDTPTFFASFSKNSGVDLTPFMKQWFYTPAAPKLTVKRDGHALVISQPAPYFDLNLDVWILDGQWIKKKVHLTAGEAKLDLEGRTVQPVLVDPECWVMANITSEIPLDFNQKRALWAAAPNAASQMRMVDSMFGDLTPGQWLELFSKGKFRSARPNLISHLDAGGIETILGPVGDKDRRYVKPALDRMANLPPSDGLIKIARNFFEHDADETVRERAFRTLLSLTKDENLARQGLSMDGVHDDFRSASVAWFVDNRPDQARTMILDMVTKPVSEDLRVTMIRSLGKLKDKAGERAVYNYLAGVLKERSFGARSAAIESLGEYGDKAALPMMIEMQSNPQVFFRNTARRIVERWTSK